MAKAGNSMITFSQLLNKLHEEDGGVPANNMGGGQIADNKKGLKYKPMIKRKPQETKADAPG